MSKRKSPMSYKQARYAELKLCGICPMCKSRELPKDRAQCDHCSRSGKPQRPYTCKRCGGTAHSVRTCPMSKAEAESRQ